MWRARRGFLAGLHVQLDLMAVRVSDREGAGRLPEGLKPVGFHPAAGGLQLLGGAPDDKGDVVEAGRAFGRDRRLHPRQLDREIVVVAAGGEEGDPTTLTSPVVLEPDEIPVEADRRLQVPDVERDVAEFADAERAIQLQPAKSGVAYYVRASLRIARGELDGAIADCDAALGIDTNDALATAMRGIAYFRQRRMDKAVQDLEASLQMNLPDSEVPTVRAMLAQAKGK